MSLWTGEAEYVSYHKRYTNKKTKVKPNFLLFQSLNEARPSTSKGGITINDYTYRVLSPMQYADYNPMLGNMSHDILSKICAPTCDETEYVTAVTKYLHLM